MAAREGTAQPAATVGVHPPSNSCPAHAAEQGNLVRSRRPSPLAVYRRRYLVGPFPSPLAADRRVAGRRRCRQREQALGPEVLEKSEAIDRVEVKVAALRDEVVELEAEQESLYHGCDTVRCSCRLRRRSIVLSAGRSLMSLPLRCSVRWPSRRRFSRGCREAGEPAEVLGLYAHRDPRCRMLPRPFQDEVAGPPVDLDARDGAEELP